jgi:magnesium-transporting ATPase (P-type)
VKSADIRVGHVIKIEKDKRVPADVILLQAYSDEGDEYNPEQVYLRTD